MIMMPTNTCAKACLKNDMNMFVITSSSMKKHDERHKARLVADGHLTDVPISSVYSGVVSLRGIRLVIFLAELNEIDSWGTDIGNTCLETFAKEKVCIKSEQEFVPLQGHALIISKSLCRLQTSGLL